MRITLIRHAEAGESPRDEERTLTARGRSDARRVGRALAKHGAPFSLILTSPLLRAVQTAEIVAAAVEHKGPVMASDLLVPDGAAARVVAFLRSRSDERSVALVAHEPILSAVAAALTGATSYPPLRKAEALRVRLRRSSAKPDKGKGRQAERGAAIRWRIDPSTGRRERL